MTNYYLFGGSRNIGLGSNWSLSNNGSAGNVEPGASDIANLELSASIYGALTVEQLDFDASVSIVSPTTTTVSNYTLIGNLAAGAVTVSSTWKNPGASQMFVGNEANGLLNIVSGGDVTQSGAIT